MRLFFLIVIEAITIFSKNNKFIEEEILFRSLNQDKSINNTNIFIVAHTDFRNSLTNKIYKIVVDEPTQLKNKVNMLA